MKNRTWLWALVAATLPAAFIGATFPQATDGGSAYVSFGDKQIAIGYTRKPLSEGGLSAIPVGSTWSFGKDDRYPATVKSGAEMAFDTVTVPRGVYGIYLRRSGQQAWELVFDKEPGRRVAERNAALDLFVVPLHSETLGESVERLTWTIDRSDNRQATLRVSWGTMSLSARFQAR